MAKLNTTVSNIELQSNKIKSAVTPSVDWTDTQYPSAKTLFNIYQNLAQLIERNTTNITDTINKLHPVGSIFMTTTPDNPSAILGGSWELVDKSFRDAWIPLNSSDWESTNATLSEKGGAFVSGVYLSNRTMSVRLSLVSTAVLNDDTLTLGKFNLQTCGLTSDTYFDNTELDAAGNPTEKPLGRLPHYITNHVASSDPGECLICYSVASDGSVTTADIFSHENNHNLPAGSRFVLNFVVPIASAAMANSFCDKFYWQRIA